MADVEQDCLNCLVRRNGQHQRVCHIFLPSFRLRVFGPAWPTRAGNLHGLAGVCIRCAAVATFVVFGIAECVETRAVGAAFVRLGAVSVALVQYAREASAHALVSVLHALFATF